MNTMTPIKVSYFGKIPSRGDFIKASDQASLLQVFDEWLAETMSIIAEDPRWKINYDSAKAISFTFLGPQKKYAIAGHLTPSSDSASRRFPFLTLGSMEVNASVQFVSNSPLIFSRLWNKLAVQSESIINSSAAVPLLQNLNSDPIEMMLDYKSYQASFNDYLEIQNLGSLFQLLEQSGFTGDLRQLIIAIGLLLQPIYARGQSELAKYLILPTSTDPMHRNLVATFWLTLITPFLSKLDIELALFLTQLKDKEVMILGFNGASPHMLYSVLTPQVDDPDHISLEDAEWVENDIHEDFGLKKLSSHLMQHDLSLRTALELFNTTFIGS